MRVLTVKQPHVSLIIEGIKNIENRTWKTNFRGRVLIHAGAKYDDRHRDHSLIFTKDQFTEVERSNLLNKSLPLSSIVGSVEIVDCVINHPSVWAEKSYIEHGNESDADAGSHNNETIYNWVLANPIKFDKPIENVKGKLSFWEYDACFKCGGKTNEIDWDGFCMYCDYQIKSIK